MKSFTAGKFSYFSFGIVVLIVLIVCMFTIVNLRVFIDNNKKVERTLLVLNKSEKTLNLITEAETGQRGYIITGKEQYLKPLNVALASDGGVSQCLRELRH